VGGDHLVAGLPQSGHVVSVAMVVLSFSADDFMVRDFCTAPQPPVQITDLPRQLPTRRARHRSGA
jgi:hypothetical protein